MSVARPVLRGDMSLERISRQDCGAPLVSGVIQRKELHIDRLRWGSVPVTSRESIDLVTAEVIRSAMETVCFEMATYVSRTATTPILNQCNERNATILDAQGRLAALSVGIPQFMLVEHPAGPLRASSSSATSCKPGDVIVANDPYHGGGHLPDFNVFAPVFDDDGELLLIAVDPVPPRRHGRGHRRRLQHLGQGHLDRRDALPAPQDHRRRQGAPGRRPDHAGQQPARRLHRRPPLPGRRSPARRRPAAESWSTRYGADAVRAAVDSHDRRRPPPLLATRSAAGPTAPTRPTSTSTPTRRATTTSTCMSPSRSTGDHLIVDFDGSDDRPDIAGLVHVRQHAGQRHRPAGQPGRPVHPEERGVLRLRRAARPGSAAASTPRAASRSAAARTTRASRWATRSPSPCAQIIPERCAPQTYKFGSPRQMWGDRRPAHRASPSSTTAARSTPAGSTASTASTAGVRWRRPWAT